MSNPNRIKRKRARSPWKWVQGSRLIQDTPSRRHEQKTLRRRGLWSVGGGGV